jgi:succinyl-CoA synthetase beta subunit
MAAGTGGTRRRGTMVAARLISISRYLDVETLTAGPLTHPSLRATARNDWKQSVDLYEYQARDLFEKYGVPVLPGIVADTPEDVRAAAEQLGGVVVVKAQVKTGGRGKAGGVKVAKNPDEAEEAAKAILGLDIKGHVVKRVMVAGGARIAQEFYFSVLLDRANRSYLSLTSVEGGMDIEQLAVEKPEALARIEVDPGTGITPD